MESLLQLFGHVGIVIVFFCTLLHEIGLPFPLTPTVMVAGAALSELTGLPLLIITVVVGSLIGNAIWFAAGRRFGVGMLKQLCKFSLLPSSCVGKTAGAFDRWGEAAFIIGRFIPGVSLVAPPLAGAMGMSWRRFLWLSAIGAALWATVVALLGVALKDAGTRLAPLVEHIGTSPSVMGALLVTGYIAWRWLRQQHAERLRSVPRVTVEELRRLLKGTAPPVVIDVRSVSMQRAEIGRISGALAADLGALRRHPLLALEGREVVLYCSCPNEVSAAAGALILQRRGHTRVRVLLGGLEAWVGAEEGSPFRDPEIVAREASPT
jgi:membrane protein DedA with SNARE-associated domain/rhodanese-related sulfurtransferase